VTHAISDLRNERNQCCAGLYTNLGCLAVQDSITHVKIKFGGKPYLPFLPATNLDCIDHLARKSVSPTPSLHLSLWHGYSPSTTLDTVPLDFFLYVAMLS
jgi:hypothetical protein